MNGDNKKVKLKRKIVVGNLTCLQFEQKVKRDRELIEQLHFWQTLLDAIPNPIFYKDGEGFYRGCNKAFATYLGLEKNEILGKSIYQIAPQEMIGKCHKMDEELLHNQGVQVCESRVLCADGNQYDVIVNKATFTNSRNELAGIVGIILDITERNSVQQALKQSSERLQNVIEQIVQAMATITESRDMYTAGHQKRVSELAVAIANELGLPEDRVEAVKVAGMLHDIGKIAVPSEILTKPGKLTFHETGIVRAHADVGYGILKTIEFPWHIADIVHQHHERLDGSGYPQGLRGTAIKLEAQIIAVADVVEAMSSHRPYRPSLGTVQAITEINFNKGLLYDTDVVDACIRIFEKGYLFRG